MYSASSKADKAGYRSPSIIQQTPISFSVVAQSTWSSSSSSRCLTSARLYKATALRNSHFSAFLRPLRKYDLPSSCLLRGATSASGAKASLTWLTALLNQPPMDAARLPPSPDGTPRDGCSGPGSSEGVDDRGLHWPRWRGPLGARAERRRRVGEAMRPITPSGRSWGGRSSPSASSSLSASIIRDFFSTRSERFESSPEAPGDLVSSMWATSSSPPTLSQKEVMSIPRAKVPTLVAVLPSRRMSILASMSPIDSSSSSEKE
mmetsp:Transcript_12910/g.29469  ORF Transcript_12910/g.29469 Transcript_12910/m.29469 type:complete len:262 (-) Transcript_12910:926-1711(-)